MAITTFLPFQIKLLPTQLIQILIPSTCKSLLCQQGHLHLSHVLEDGLLGKDVVIPISNTTNYFTVQYRFQNVTWRAGQAVPKDNLPNWHYFLPGQWPLLFLNKGELYCKNSGQNITCWGGK